jgi:hypothetical protein
MLGRKALADKTKGRLVLSSVSSVLLQCTAQTSRKYLTMRNCPRGKDFSRVCSTPTVRDAVFICVLDTAYQTEIDNLTKRSKVSENVFLNVYKVLAEAPDPYPLLEAAVVLYLAWCPSTLGFTTLLI